MQLKTRPGFWMDVAMIAFLVAFDVAARLLPHAPGVWPVAATALFAGRTFRIPALALVVPVIAMLLSDILLPGDDWRVLLVVMAATLVPAFAGMLARRWSGALPVVAAMLSCSLVFFATTNFAVWAFGSLYPLTWQGLVQCYVAALPFLDKTVLGDLFWTGALFGAAWLVQHRPALGRAL
jgi:uncharacterized protein DUF6580